MTRRTIAGLCLIAAFLACGGAPGAEPAEEGIQGPRKLRFEVLRVFPHDSTSFTQGLLWHDGLLYESVGRHGQSALIAWNPETGEVKERTALPPAVFGEGLAFANGELIQLTWRSGVAFRWSLPPFRKLGESRYSGEGWGLTSDPESGILYMSDGSDVLTIRDPETFEVVDTLSVERPGGEPVHYLNELEMAEGSLFANLWTTETLVRIDPGTGIVTAEIDASGLLDGVPVRGVDVLNGIAYDPEAETFWLTGKLWPLIFEGVFVE